MNPNKFIISLTFFFIIMMIGLKTTISVINNHQDKLIKVSEKRIIEATQKCVYEEICKDNIITLKYLYENNYLEKEANPLTKEHYNEESYIEIKDNTYLFNAI